MASRRLEARKSALWLAAIGICRHHHHLLISYRRSAASAALAAVLVAAGCGSSGNARALVAQAQRGLARIHSGTITVRASADTPVPLKRTVTLQTSEIPLRRIDLLALTSHAHRVSCEPGLECAKADVDVKRALRTFRPLLPPLPVDPKSVHDATVEVALAGGKPRYLKLLGKVDAGFLLGDVPFEVELDLPRSR
jgi:hypothetical protein